MSVQDALQPPVVPPGLDERVILNGVTWKDYELMLLIRGDRSAPRLAYLDGQIEIMNPSRSHEYIKKNIARILEAWALRRRIRLNGVGSWTLKNPQAERAVEPDECYIIGPKDGREEPDLAIEVVWTSGGLSKLEIYRKLGVREVWTWKNGKILVHVLEGEQYRQVEDSEILPTLDVELVARFCTLPDQLDAIEGFLAAIE